MTKVYRLMLLVLITAAFSQCQQPETKDEVQEKVSQNESSPHPTEQEIGVLIEEIDNWRREVENSTIVPVEISTSNLREKIKQKWSKIHFYVKGDDIVKVKTYPYPEITKRTEEFYARDGQLVLAVIEDNGEGEKGKPINEIDKLYYFHNGKLIKEIKNAAEPEYTIRESDAEELLSEFAEYQETYKSKSAQR